MRRDLVALCAGAIAISIYLFSKRPEKQIRREQKRTTEFVIDPSIVNAPSKKPVKLMEAPRQQTTEHPYQRAPHERSGFGHDSSRNNDDTSVDDYLNLPLVGSGLTFENKYVYQEVDDEVSDLYREVKRFKFVRLSILDANSDIVHIGGIDFMKGSQSIGDVTLWNPHTGEKTAYSKGEFSDRDQLTFVFCFKAPMVFDRYRVKSSNEGTQYDPKEWLLEGSVNGNYWTPVDQRPDVRFPILRGMWTTFLIPQAPIVS